MCHLEDACERSHACMIRVETISVSKHGVRIHGRCRRVSQVFTTAYVFAHVVRSGTMVALDGVLICALESSFGVGRIPTLDWARLG